MKYAPVFSFKKFTLAAAVTVISACGVDSFSPDPVANIAPTANAGADQTVTELTTVTLTAAASSDSDGSIASYAWSQTSGTTVTLSDMAVANPTFTAPDIAGSEVLTFSVTVTDDDGETATDTVTITSLNKPTAPSVTATAGDTSVDVTWSAVTSADEYTLYYATETFEDLNDITNYASLAGGTMVDNITGTSQTISSLVNGTKYFFVLVAADATVESDISAEQSTRPSFLTTLGISMVELNAAGQSFEMGCNGTSGAGIDNVDANCETDEKPEHTVTFTNSFAMGTHEVTFAAWDACVTDGGCAAYTPNDEGWGRGTRPVINVSYNDIQTFFAWLYTKTTEIFRLPTESEWEYAARAGTNTVYSWGDTIGTNNANCHGCTGGFDNTKTAPVGTYAANAFGLYDMHGNIWEWTEDIYYNDYASVPIDGSASTVGGGTDRVLRGGSWNYNPFYLRSAFRFRLTPTSRSSSFGFRLVQDL